MLVLATEVLEDNRIKNDEKAAEWLADATQCIMNSQGERDEEEKEVYSKKYREEATGQIQKRTSIKKRVRANR